MSTFPGERTSACSHLGPPPSVLEENFWGLEKWAFYRPDSHLVTQQSMSMHCGKHKALAPNQWPGLILSSSPTSLLTEGKLLPLCQLFNVTNSRWVKTKIELDGCTVWIGMPTIQYLAQSAQLSVRLSYIFFKLNDLHISTSVPATWKKLPVHRTST